MDICRKCHDRDKNVTKCEKPVDDHLDMPLCIKDYHKFAKCETREPPAICEICGEVVEHLYTCFKYDEVGV